MSKVNYQNDIFSQNLSLTKAPEINLDAVDLPRYYPVFQLVFWYGTVIVCLLMGAAFGMYSGEMWVETQGVNENVNPKNPVEAAQLLLFCVSSSILMSHFIIRPIYIAIFRRSGLLPLKVLIVSVCIHLGSRFEGLCGVIWNYIYNGFQYVPPDPASAALWVSYNHISFFMWTLIIFGLLFMQRRKNELIRRNNLESAVRQAQISGLKQQLNPHFVFNTLNSLRAMILKDKQVAKRMLTEMENLLRYSLTQSEKNTVSLSDELAIVRDYLSIEKLRFKDRIDVYWNIPEGLLSYQVVPLSLQTLVENAVKYGINQYEDGMFLRIDTYRDNHCLVLSVENRGKIVENAGIGIGLQNIRQRLALIFGEQAELSLAQKEPETVSATISIPLNTKGINTLLRHAA